MTSTSPLPLKFSLKTQNPFTIYQEKFALEPGKSVQFKVSFDPSFKKDKKSDRVIRTLNVDHDDHP